VLVNDEPLLAAVALGDARRAVAKRRVDVIAPQIERLEDVTIGIDDIVGATHTRFLLNRCEFDAPHPGPLPAGGERESSRHSLGTPSTASARSRGCVPSPRLR